LLVANPGGLFVYFFLFKKFCFLFFYFAHFFLDFLLNRFFGIVGGDWLLLLVVTANYFAFSFFFIH